MNVPSNTRASDIVSISIAIPITSDYFIVRCMVSSCAPRIAQHLKLIKPDAMLYLLSRSWVDFLDKLAMETHLS